MKQVKVLLIEDDEDQALLIADFLAEESEGFDVDVAFSWKDCEGKKLSSYDIVLLDYNLPDISGLDALSLILSQADLPVIFVTGENESETAMKALRAGAFDYIVKAGDYLHALPVNINKVIEQFRIRKEKERLEGELRKSLEELREMQEKLIQTEKLSAIGKLVAGVAHEINNPLTGIVGYAQILLGKKEDLDPLVRKGLEVIYEEAQRAARIVQNLLQFARKHPPRRSYISINSVIEKTIELKEYELRVNNIHLSLDLAPNLPMTMADPHQLQQVFINIITNAQQAIMEAGRERGRISIKTEPVMADPPLIRISFTDNGKGIPEEIINKIFDPFFTTKDVGEGTGLGLSICYGIIKEHNGNIYASNLSGGGAVLTVELPVVEPVMEFETEEESADTASLPSLRILVVDDELSIQDMLVDMLSADGHKVDTASNGQVALEKLRTRGYDLIISDIKMPGMNGQSFYEYLSGVNPAMSRRIIFITGDTLSRETEEFLESVGVPHIEKPFSLEEMLVAIRKALSL
ncbi:response regulator [Candidatus Poribacteria bacterium]|nr:response regulator [Candidatus Poribacteria bacterium]